MTTPTDTHDHEHDHEEEEDDGVVVLTDAEGNEVEFGILGFVQVDEQTYALMAPVEQLDDEESEDFDVYIFHYEFGEDGDESFSEVADPEVFEKVKAEADKFFANMEESDEGAEQEQ